MILRVGPTLVSCFLFSFAAQASGASTSPDPAPFLGATMLQGTWHRSSGDTLIIDPGGAARFVDKTGRTLLTAKVLVLSWEPATNVGMLLDDIVTLSLVMADTTCTIPGYVTAGEGDSPGLSVMLVPGPLAWRLHELLKVEACGVLTYHGASPP